MLNLYGYEQTIQSVFKACRFLIGQISIKTQDDLATAYRQMLRVYVPDLPVGAADPFVRDLEVEKKLCEYFSFSLLNDLKQEAVVGNSFVPEVLPAKIARADRELQCLLSADPYLANVFRIVVHSIMVRESRVLESGRICHAGTTSGAPGVIWLSMTDEPGSQDIKEAFVHELTHTLVFIDEMTNTQFYYDEMVKKEHFTDSAILNKRRPADKAIHSIIVATEVVLTRFRFLGGHDGCRIHPDTQTILNSTILACESVLAKPWVDKVLTEWTRTIVLDCYQTCQELLK